MRLTAYPGTLRQLVTTGLGREQPTVIITNERQATIRDLIGRYARRMTIEQRLAEIIRAFCADAPSSTVNLNVDLDIMLAVLAKPCCRTARPAARLRRRRPRRHPTPLLGNPRPGHHHQRHHHRPARTPRLLIPATQSQPPAATPFLARQPRHPTTKPMQP